ncbi:L-rhamnose mutarotase [Streptomyces puniciscabiei]|uniref:L-rhamnose mutarotase n=1 Tax=Streptomyces puniciscabiei TaxID=164348 RepID=A0A542SZI7_9ACTN|nr:L-rhamnose mutarotase [Streptomyces puniciscabiei]TQK80033.1 L-rhamnose mutarotase [Streptomyces puniciscabiei]
MRVALHTKVRPDRIAAYEAAHRAVPEELTRAIRAAGATSWTIWRWGSPRASEAERGGGSALFHLLDCADYGRLLAQLEQLPVNVAWQARTAELLDVVHDYSEGGGNAGLPVVWELP